LALSFEVNLSILFTELPLLERPAAVAGAGFDAAEFWWPFASAAPAAADIDAFVNAVRGAGVSLVALNFFAGDMPGGERGVVSWPQRRQEFRDSVDVLVAIAQRTGARRFNALYGQRLPGVEPAEQDALAAENLAYAARQVSSVDGVVLVESLAQGENGAYPLRTIAEALAVIDRARSEGGVDNIAFLYDTYHLARNGEDVVAVAASQAGQIGHVQVADAPGRHQPGTGDLRFNEIFAALQRGGYDGWVGCEYKPLGPSGESFGWLADADAPWGLTSDSSELTR
jgi:hydroxypyruvate isomerase